MVVPHSLRLTSRASPGKEPVVTGEVTDTY
jgi:hypothetical protein